MRLAKARIARRLQGPRALRVAKVEEIVANAVVRIAASGAADVVVVAVVAAEIAIATARQVDSHRPVRVRLAVVR